MGVLAVPDRHHPAPLSVPDEVHRDVGKGDRDHLVERIRFAAAQVVGQLARHRLDARPPSDLLRQCLAHVDLVAVAVGVRLAVFSQGSALPHGPLRRDDEGVPAGVVALVLGQDRGQAIQVEWCLGDEAPSGGDIGGEQRREAAIAPEDPEDADSLVRAKRRPLPVDHLLGPGHGRRKADAVLGSLDVVVHRLGDRDEGDPVGRQDLGEAQRVVPADCHEVVEPERLDVLQHEGSQVVQIVAGRVAGRLGCGQPGWQRRRAHPARVGPRRVQPGAPGPIDRPCVDPIKRAQVGRVEQRTRLHVGQALPASANPDRLVAELDRPIDDALDDRVETGDVTAASQDAYATNPRHMLVLPVRQAGTARLSHAATRILARQRPARRCGLGPLALPACIIGP